MKNILTLFLFLVSNAIFSQDYSAYTIFTKDGKKTSFSKIIKSSKDKKAIFFGELHNNAIAHWLQQELLIALYHQHSTNLVCGSEMFEQDNQKALNLYLNNTYDEKKLKDSCRLWPNFKTDYQPLLDFAKENKVKWIATNIPRKYASLVYKKSVKALDSLSVVEKKWIAPLPIIVDTTLTQYAALLNGEQHMGNNFVYAQAIKDATMAWFISQNSNENTIFYHLNGSYHSDYFQGILWYLNFYSKMEFSNMLTISTVEQKDISKLSNEYLGKADFIICVPENMTKTH